ncbi:hypothetical protein [Methylorubrum extorquens]
MNGAQVQTVADYAARGYRDLRIMRCSYCDHESQQTWIELGAGPKEDILAVASRVRCRECNEFPIGLPVVTFLEAA